MAVANTTLSEELRQKLQSLAGPTGSADELANEILSKYFARQGALRELEALSNWGRQNSKLLGHKPSDVLRAIGESRRENRER